MATATQTWQIKGQYFETCSCDYVCPCLTTNLAARPSKGSCTFAMVFEIEAGRFQETPLDGVKFAVVGRTPGVMGEGNWSVGLIADDRANADQQQALAAIVSGQAGGPMANLAPLVGEFLGIESAPIELQRDGLRRTASIPGRLEQAAEGIPGGGDQAEPLYLDNTLHPANTRLALAKSTASRLHAFGLDWEDASGGNNAHFAPFDWRGA
jgi:hypothetical protein